MTDLPENDHFVRHCSTKHFDEDQDGNYWIHGAAFEPTVENPNISGLWLEYYAGDWSARLRAVRIELADSSRTVRSSHKLAIVEILDIQHMGEQHSRKLSVRHSPLTDMPSHCEIAGIQPMDTILQQEIADCCVLEDATE